MPLTPPALDTDPAISQHLYSSHCALSTDRQPPNLRAPYITPLTPSDTKSAPGSRPTLAFPFILRRFPVEYEDNLRLVSAYRLARASITFYFADNRFIQSMPSLRHRL